MAVNSSVEKQPVDQQASGEVQAEIDTRSDGVSPMPNDVSKIAHSTPMSCSTMSHAAVST
jgi:hypothetical protein